MSDAPPCAVEDCSQSSCLQARGVKDIVGVDISLEMLDRLTKKFGNSPVLGNEPAVRTWLGDFMDLPAYYVRLPCIE